MSCYAVSFLLMGRRMSALWRDLGMNDHIMMVVCYY